MDKPIEPGCLAIIYGLSVYVDLNGVSVQVLRRTQHGEWLKDKDGIFGLYSDARGGWIVKNDEWIGVEPLAEKNLLRIDDYTEEAETQEQELTV